MNPNMRPKVTTDTFFLPDPEGVVYFRNNRSSFRMQGAMIDKWIEKLIPVFNGEHTLQELTSGLPEAHRHRVFEIAEGLQQNGFVRDVSGDHPHALPERITGKFAAQIEFLDSSGGSGAYRFQTYRRSKVLAAGSGPMLISLMSALLESGLADFRLMITDGTATDRKRLSELAAYARLTDPDVRVEEAPQEDDSASSWRKMIQPYDWILFAACENEVERLRSLHAACRETGKKLLPALMLKHSGIAGPLVSPDSEACWESAWRRIHRTALTHDPESHAPSATAEALLADLLAFELFKAATGTDAPGLSNQIFVLNLETLEGSRHPVLPHPCGNQATEPARWHGVNEVRPEEPAVGESESGRLFAFFSRLTSSVTGIFHQWEEGEFKQLPLSVCRVQPVDPLSEGPAGLLPGMLCGGFTHEAARREAGLAGIEAYASRWFQPPESVTVGTGQTKEEAICRGLYRLLLERAGQWNGESPQQWIRAESLTGSDPKCDYYLRSLNTLKGPPLIAAGKDVEGFPVAWAGSGGVWYQGVGFTRVMAVRHALVQALMDIQCGTASKRADIVLAAWEEKDYGSVLASAKRILAGRGARLAVCDLTGEPFMKEELAGAYGVTIVRGVETP